LWAHASNPENAPPQRETIEVGEIETGNMDIQEKSNLLHSVALDAQSDLKEQIRSQRQTDDEHRKEIYRDAESLDLQIMDIQKMHFSANELNDFSAMTTQNSQKSYDQPRVEKSPIKIESPHNKDFFE
jgi:hypothetical protein